MCKKAVPTLVLCLHCQNVFEKRTSAKFCSVSCRGKHRRQTKPEWYKAHHLKNKARSNAASMQHYRRTKEITPWKILIAMAKVRAKKIGVPFNLDDTWAASRWTGCCEMAGLRFVLGKGGRGARSPSIDRIKPANGYTKENCRFVLWAINNAKGTGTDEDLCKIAEALMRNPQPTAGILALPI